MGRKGSGGERGSWEEGEGTAAVELQVWGGRLWLCRDLGSTEKRG